MKTLHSHRFWTIALGATLLGAGLISTPCAYAAGADPQIIQTTLDSDNFRAGLVNTFYKKFLGRAATSAESTPLVAKLQEGGTAWVSVVTTIIGSPAYYKKAGGTDAAFVNRMFQDLVGRVPDPAEEAPAAIDYLKGGGTRDQLAGVIADNDTFRLYWTQNFYQNLLGRAPSEAETTESIASLTAEGITGLLNIILSSPEYFQNNGGTQKGWQNAVNQSLLDKAGSGNIGNGNAGGNNGGNANNGEMGGNPVPVDNPPPPNTAPNGSRAGLVQNLLTSPEYYSNIVLRYYKRFLDRAPSSAETQQWVGMLQGGNSQDQVVMGILTSDEYFTKAGGNTNAYMNQLSEDLLGKGGGPSTKSTSTNKKNGQSKIDLLEILRNLPRN